MRDLEVPRPEYSGRGRRPKAPWQSVTDWRKSLHPAAWRRLTVRDGEKGPVAIEMVKCRVQTRIERKRTGPQEWLVVTRRPLTDERTLEPRASRDATDQDEHHRYHYYLTPPNFLPYLDYGSLQDLPIQKKFSRYYIVAGAKLSISKLVT